MNLSDIAEYSSYENFFKLHAMKTRLIAIDKIHLSYHMIVEKFGLDKLVKIIEASKYDTKYKKLYHLYLLENLQFQENFSLSDDFFEIIWQYQQFVYSDLYPIERKKNNCHIDHFTSFEIIFQTKNALELEKLKSLGMIAEFMDLPELLEFLSKLMANYFMNNYIHNVPLNMTN